MSLSLASFESFEFFVAVRVGEGRWSLDPAPGDFGEAARRAALAGARPDAVALVVARLSGPGGAAWTLFERRPDTYYARPGRVVAGPASSR